MALLALPRTPPTAAAAVGASAALQRRTPRRWLQTSGTVTGNAGATAGKQGHFGSFHNSDVAELLADPSRLPPLDPAWPQPDRSQLTPAMAQPGFFGSASCRSHFLLAVPPWTFINHGAFGGSLRLAHQLAEAWRLYQEQQPLRFFDRVLLPELARRIHQLSAQLHCAAASQLVLVPNATTALNAAISSLASERLVANPGSAVSTASASLQRPRKSQPTILTLDLAYGAVKTMVKEALRRASQPPEALHEVKVNLPLSSAQSLVDQVAAELEALDRANRRPAFAVFDHITSNTGLVLPVADLAHLCAGRGIPVLVDGAHGPLQLPLDLEQLGRAGVTHYVANCHKWLCSPKGCGLFWVRDRSTAETLAPLNISHGFGYGFASNFLWDGCRDYAAALALPACWDFWQACGGEGQVREYTYRLLQQAAAMLRQRWGTGGLAPPDMHANMALVEVPKHCRLPAGVEVEYKHAQALQDWLYERHIEVPVKRLQGRLYVRISAHVYNCMADYERLAEALGDEYAAEHKSQSGR